jgi:DNA-binding MarR family transcriptional regulator
MAEVFHKEVLPDAEKLEGFKKFAPDINPEKIATLIRIVSGNNLIINKLEWYFSQYNLSMGRFQIMIDLYFNLVGCGENGVCPAQLAERFSVKSATISGILATMEKDGFITRGRCHDDRRRVRVNLTEEGRAFMKDFLPKHFSNMVVLLNKVDLDELKELDARLDKLRGHLDEFAAEAFGSGNNKTNNNEE